MKSKFLFIIVFSSLLYTSCEKVLEKTPESTFSPNTFYKTAADALAAITSAYDPIMSNNLYYQNMWVIQEQSTDDAEWGAGRTTSNQAKNDLDKYTFTSATTTFYTTWTALYNGINRANTVIGRVPAITMDETLKAQYIGEAKFLRAFYYFTLVRLWGDVPIVLQETTNLNDITPTRKPASEVYAQIIKDFTDAEGALPMTYTGSSIGRATKGAATAFLASVYLTTKDWTKAAAAAKQVIDLEAAGRYGLLTNYSDNFLVTNKNNKESIFEGQALSGGFGEGSTLDGYMRPAFDRAGFGDNPPTTSIYNAYSSNDLRRSATLRLYVSGVSPSPPASIVFPCYISKYKDPTTTGNNDGNNNYPIMRYAEVLLIYAEALNELTPNDPVAFAAVNRLRTRANIAPLSINLTQSQMRDAILLERRLELAFESHRRYDLLRTGKLIEAIKAQNSSLNVQPFHVLFPIPQQERDVNPNLTQNSGY